MWYDERFTLIKMTKRICPKKLSCSAQTFAINETQFKTEAMFNRCAITQNRFRLRAGAMNETYVHANSLIVYLQCVLTHDVA